MLSVVSFIVFSPASLSRGRSLMFSESGCVGPKFSRSFSAGTQKATSEFKKLFLFLLFFTQTTNHARSPRWRRPELMMLWRLRVELGRVWFCILTGKNMTAFPSSIPFYDAYFQKFFRRFTMSLTEHALPSEYFSPLLFLTRITSWEGLLADR